VWTERLLAQTQLRYPALELGPWRAALRRGDPEEAAPS